MWVELQRLIFEILAKKSSGGFRDFFVLYGRFLRVFWKMAMVNVVFFVVKLW
jgi:hypothetical protein